MLVPLVFYCLFRAATADEQFQPHIPFFVMQPHTIINQTLHSYCKEQFDLNMQPMFINLRQWPSGFIYARNPLAAGFDDEGLLIRECTMELHASAGDRIRLVFYPAGNEYDTDYFLTIPKVPCLKIRDGFETTVFECPMVPERSKSAGHHRPSDDYLSASDSISLEMIPPPMFANEYDDSYHHFKLFFTAFTPTAAKSSTLGASACPRDRLLDCDDGFCVHIQTRCNGIAECRSKVDEEACKDDLSRGTWTHRVSTTVTGLCIILARLSTTLAGRD